MDVRFKVPSNFYISGQSQCGKSYLVRRLLYHLNELFHPVPSKVVYCYGEYQKEFDELRGVDFIEGFPQDLNELTQGQYNTSCIFCEGICCCHSCFSKYQIYCISFHNLFCYFLLVLNESRVYRRHRMSIIGN